MPISARAKAAIAWLVTQRREANSSGFHSFVCRSDRKLTAAMVVDWFNKNCPELTAHSKGETVYLATQPAAATH